MMMKKLAVIGIMIVVLFAANRVQAQSCQIINGSFEDPGWIPDITVQEPNGWDVNIPAGKFGGYVDNDWVTDANWNLTLYTQWVKLDANNTAIVSQELDLTDANEIIFDLKMELLSGAQWDPNKVCAVVLIDGEVAWDSNNLSSGEYYDRVYTVEDKYRDETLHTVSFGMRVKVSEKLWQTYITYWDYIECVCFECLPEDFNRDGFVNFLDFAMLANYWGEAAPAEYDLVVDGTIDEYDLDVFVEYWLKRSCIEEPIE
jgi:hypothetical protein